MKINFQFLSKIKNCRFFFLQQEKGEHKFFAFFFFFSFYQYAKRINKVRFFLSPF